MEPQKEPAAELFDLCKQVIKAAGVKQSDGTTEASAEMERVGNLVVSLRPLNKGFLVSINRNHVAFLMANDVMNAARPVLIGGDPEVGLNALKILRDRYCSPAKES